MKTLLKKAKVVNVFTEKIDFTNVFIEDDRITGIGDYYKDEDADEVEDLEGRFLCPGFIDGHIHIESTMMVPPSLAQAVLPHGTTAVVTDPQEIANVCGVDGIKYMLEMSENIPLHVFVMIPSCVPATCFDEAGAVLNAENIEDLYKETESAAKKTIIQIDKRRANHYNTFTENTWGDRKNYDIMINSSVLGIEDTAALITEMVKKSK